MKKKEAKKEEKAEEKKEEKVIEVMKPQPKKEETEKSSIV